MEVLKLLIKSKSFEEVISGKRKLEVREITPSTQSKYLIVTPNEVTIKLYDAIRFVAGNEPDAPEALVKVEKTELDFEPDEEGYIQLYEEGKALYIEGGEMYYTLGEILETKNIHRFS
ncbi:MAG: hypothetical protein RR202_08045 [Bacteroidales bacterium]